LLGYPQNSEEKIRGLGAWNNKRTTVPANIQTDACSIVMSCRLWCQLNITSVKIISKNIRNRNRDRWKKQETRVKYSPASMPTCELL